MTRHPLTTPTGERITTNRTMTSDLRRTLREHGAVVGSLPTWGDFKAAGDALVRDDEPLASVEYGISQAGNGKLYAERDEHGAWELKEGSYGDQ